MPLRAFSVFVGSATSPEMSNVRHVLMPLRAFSVFVAINHCGDRVHLTGVLMPLRAFSVFVAYDSIQSIRGVLPASLNALTGIQCIRRGRERPVPQAQRPRS